MFKTTFIIVLALMVAHCTAQEVDAVVTINPNMVINESYLGNGAQWDPYQEDYGEKQLKISQEDWQKLYDRLDFMKPQVMRVMINTTSMIEDGKLVVTKNLDKIEPILEYCQSRNVTVTFGDWGGKMVDSNADTISKEHLEFAARYVEFLIKEKGFTCIEYYNMINEPNGDWSVTNEDYDLWERAVGYFETQLDRLDLKGELKIMGPDIAIWEADKTDWITRSHDDLGSAIGLYDIHTYPSKVTVNSGEYSKIIRAYKEEVPLGTPIIMGEIGFKFVEEEDAALNAENIRRAKAKPYASVEDSQMFVYDYSYGTDMADALFQTVNAGYSGCVVWMLDDAMHSKEAKNKLKVWGFWNILGEEYFGRKEEDVRPWYYAWALLTKYMPQGAKVFEVNVEGNPNIKAIAVEKDDHRMIAIVNVGDGLNQIKINAPNFTYGTRWKDYLYADGQLNKKGDHIILPDHENISLEEGRQIQVDLPKESLYVLTNFDY